MNINRSRWASLSLFAIACTSIFSTQTPADTGIPGGRADELTGSSEQEKRTKGAEGEYVIVQGANGGAVGPFGEEVYNFRETWTLWRLARDQYEIEGERQFESPKGTARSNRFLVQLSRDLTVTHVTE